MFRASNFDKLLEKATSNLRLDPDWPTIIQICDLIRQNDCSPKYAVSAVKKKLYSQNPHQAMFGLLTLESIVKNCGSGVHDEVTSKAFCEMLRELVKTTQHENLRNKILELIQAWAFAFRNSPKYRAVQDTVNILKAEGYKFPPLKESDAMFSADTAPEWADGEVCHRCRVAFSLIVRRHHCRACGQVFCQLCSSKTSTLPKFGIEKEVRVCDACFDKVSRPPTSSAKLEVVDAANDYGPTQPKKSPGGKSAEELQEEEELQLALALSQSEAEQKEKERKSRAHIAPDPTPHHPTVSPSPSTVSASPEHSTQANTELSRYLDRNYWEQRRTRDNGAAAPTAPAPASHTSNDTNDDFPKVTNPKSQEDDAEDKEIDEFVETLKSQVEIFVNRMKSNSSRGRSIANDTAVQTLFMNITAMHSRLLKYIQLQDDKRVYLESLQDKVSQIKDSRAALDTLRAEHAARLAAAAEAAERQRQMQMAAKLQAMRKKKHEYLQYQRQLALQRVQEQEREMQMRQEQQKHQYMMSANSGYYMPGVSMNQFQPGGYPNQPIYGNPQFHPQMMPQSANDASLTMPGQPPISQPNMPLNPNQITSITQPMTHMTNTYAMSTSLPAVGQPPNTQPSMNQNIRPQLAQQMSLQQQMMMQQMHQIRLSAQPGMHHMVPPQGVTNGPSPQQNGQNPQIPKQNLPNQPQHTNAIPPVTIGQQNMPQPMMNQNNQILGMHMQNMRMPLVQGNPPNANNQQVPVSSYPMNMQNQNQSIPQVHNAQQQPQISLANQPMVMPGQMLQAQSLPSHHPQGLAIPNHIPQNNQSMPNQGTQVPQTQNQPMHPQGQHTQTVHGHPTGVTGQPGQQMMIHGQQLGPQGQNIPQIGQQMLNQGLQGPMQPGQQIQQMIPGQQMAPQMHSSPMPHQLPQAPQLQGQLPQQIVGQGQQIPVGQPQPNSGQPIKLQQPNFVNAPQDQQQHAASQAQQAQAPVKSEHNNNTAELISFD